MNVMMENVFPVILVFLFGFFLKKIGVFTQKDADSLLKVFFHVSFPTLIFLSVVQMKFSMYLLWLPVIAVLIIFMTFLVSHGVNKLLNLNKPSFGTFLIGSMIMNTGFILPFLIAVKGEESLAQASLFDFGNTALVFTFIYYLACKYGSKSSNFGAMIRKFAYSPPLLALIFALFLNMNSIKLPNVATQFLKITGYMTVPLMMLSLGIYYNPKAFMNLSVFSAVFIRMGIGLFLGFIFVYLFNLKGISKEVVLVISSAPSGISTLVFSSMEGLDNEFAASIVSYSVLAGIFIVPIVLHFSS